MKKDGKIRVLLAKPGLDGHDVGAKIVVRALLDAGFDVIYTGLKQSPDEIARRARAEEVDIIGLSILSGSHIPLCRRLRESLRTHALENVLWVVGGNIPKKDHQALLDLGVSTVFPVGTPPGSIVDYLREHVT